MKTIALLLLSLFLTGCYTSFNVVDERPQRTVVANSSPTLAYYYSPYFYHWNGYRYVYIRYNTYPYYINRPVVVNNTTVVNNRRTVRQQPRSTGLSNRNTPQRRQKLERNRQIRNQHINIRSNNRSTRTVQPRNRSTVRQESPTRNRSTVTRSTTTRNDRGSNNRQRSRNNN